MSRALTLQRTIVPPGERKKFLERAALRREHYKRSGCQLWLFEESALSGAFIEFIEGTSEESLAAALASAPDEVVDPGRIYTEVELT